MLRNILDKLKQKRRGGFTGGVIAHLGQIRHRILSNVNTPKASRQNSTSRFKALAAPIIL